MSRKKTRINWPILRRRLFKMVSVGVTDDPINQGYDVISTLALILNLVISVLYTFDGIGDTYQPIFYIIEEITVAFFALDYGLRLLTAVHQFPGTSERQAIRKYMTSLAGIVDLASFLPFYLPFFFPAGAVAFRLFRVARILRLFRINAYYDSLNVITEVLKRKRQQILSAFFIILLLMLASSLCMYSLEHEAQPEVFANAFSGIWWASSTLLTVGYGDIYPITLLGKIFGIVITFLGVGLVAIPTGIISAGFVEQYTRLKRIGDIGQEEDIHFIKVVVKKDDPWTGQRIMDLGLPQNVIIAMIRRGGETLIPRGDVVINSEDVLIIGAEAIQNDEPVNLKEIILRKEHPWNGTAIKDLDISRQTFIIMVRRGNATLIPTGSLILLEGDVIILYSKRQIHLPDETELTV